MNLCGVLMARFKLVTIRHTMSRSQRIRNLSPEATNISDQKQADENQETADIALGYLSVKLR